ncbi:MAG TPA: hypothetical protein PKY78_06025 [Candidatus Omnitrophota bacterium]|nr:hypothetical protein [Candidatus Omnitrophota bacterium]HPS20525.1 hypothetical protein [Candidatus Omnitrophota bacterium]
MKKSLLLSVLALALSANIAFAEESVIFGFENGLQGWDVPEWAYEKPDHVQKEIKVTKTVTKEGTQAMEIVAAFPGGSWSGAIIEVQQYFDWSDYTAIAYDVYIPAEAPAGLKTKMILTVGDTWQWVEMSKDVELIPGQWVTVQASLVPGSIDWRRVQVDDKFRRDVRKMDIRVVSEGKPVYSGSIYIDNIRLIK